ncbi:DUF4440 domain-containing protein [Gaopeijia maritima]|uniref:YybH family protein n=1 Tax=Gaopeijia maritima TaxID=3119007 RepID=UPI003246C1D6
MVRRFDARALALLLFTVTLAAPLRGQQAEVESAVRATLDAWSAGDYQGFVDAYHPEARGFFLDGGDLIQAFSLDALEATAEAGFRAEVTLRDLDVAVYGTTSVAVGYIEGQLVLPGGITLQGPWRYSETRVRTDGAWRIVQFHLSKRGM